MKARDKAYILKNYPSRTIAQIARHLKISERKVKKVTDKIKPRAASPVPLSLPVIKPQRWLWSFLLIVFLGGLVYANSLSGSFIWDDLNLVQDNSYIRTWSNIPKAFSTNVGAGAGSEYNFYRPLQIATYMFDYSLWQLKPLGYHLSNIGIHILTACLVLVVAYLLSVNWALALTTATLFVVHPVHTETVSYISGRADSLSALFVLLSLFFYIKNDRSSHRSFPWLILCSFALALFSKENSLVFPFLLLVYHYSFRRPLIIKRFLPVCALAGGYILLRLTWLKDLLSHATHSTTFLQRLPGFFAALTNYFRVLFFPWELHMEYGAPLFRFSEPLVLLGLLILGGLVFLVYRNKSQRGLPTFCVLWFIVALLPSANLYPINAYMAEHWLYLPSLGIFLFLSSLLTSSSDKNVMRAIKVSLTVALTIYFSLLTIKQNGYWHDPVSFCLKTLKYAPNSVKLNNELGRTYNNQEEFQKAIPYFVKAINLNPKYYKAYNNLAISYYRIGEFEKAIPVLEAALKIYPRYAKAYNTLAASYQQVGKPEMAIATYRQAVAINSDYPQAYYNWGNIYLGMGKTAEAGELFKKAIALKPDYANAYKSLAIVHQQAGRPEAALAAYQQALRLDPRLSDPSLPLNTQK